MSQEVDSSACREGRALPYVVAYPEEGLPMNLNLNHVHVGLFLGSLVATAGLTFSVTTGCGTSSPTKLPEEAGEEAGSDATSDSPRDVVTDSAADAGSDGPPINDSGSKWVRGRG